MSLYTPQLVTLGYVRQHRRLQGDETEDDALLVSFIREASGEVIEALGRVPIPYRRERRFDYSDPYCIDFDEDCLEVVTLTNGDGSTLASSSFTLRPTNSYPKWRLAVKVSAAALTFASDPFEAVLVDGWWGYVPNYPRCWLLSGVNVPVGGLTAGATTLALAAGAGARFEAGQYVRIDDEVLQITAINIDTLSLARAELGTTAAAHTAGASLRVYQLLPDIAAAVRELAVYRYKTKDRLSGRVQVFDGGAVQVEDVDRSVYETLRRHRKYGAVAVL